MSKSQGPNILYWDIETSLMKVYTFGLFPDRISIQDVIQDWKILCICYAWNDEKAERIVGTERMILKKFSRILNRADISVYHNGDKFDLKKFKAKLIEHRLPPVKNFTTANTVDTLKVAKKEAKFSSNKLDYISRTVMKIGQKLETNKNLWIKCTEGCKKSINKMATYCEQDVELLREVYVRLRPYMSSHPNWNLYTDEDVCPTCGSNDVVKNGVTVTRTSKYQRYRCKSCNSEIRGKRSIGRTIRFR